MSLGVESLEFLGGLVQFDLSGLGLGDFLFELLGLFGDFDGELLDVEGEFLDFGFVCPSVLFESQVIFFFLSCGQCPLFQFFLVPIHNELELVHFFISFEDHILDIVQSILLVSNSLLELILLVFESSTLSLSYLFHMLFSFDFLVFHIDLNPV